MPMIITATPKRTVTPALDIKSGASEKMPDALNIIGVITPTLAPKAQRMPYVKLTPMRRKQSIASI